MRLLRSKAIIARQAIENALPAWLCFNQTMNEGIVLLDALLTASRSELLDKDGDATLRGMLYDFFAFGRSLEAARAKFAEYVGLSPTQYLILIAIAHSKLDEPIGIKQIAARLHLSGAFITNEVNKLVADKLIVKDVHPIDARRVQLTVTHQATGKLAQLAALQRPVNDALFGMLSREEFRLLANMLGRLAANGEHAVGLAAHVEARLKLENEKIAATAVRRPKQSKPYRR